MYQTMMKKLFVCLCVLTLGVTGMQVHAQNNYYWNLGWSCIYGHRLPYVGHYSYDYFVRGEHEGEMGCARVVVAGLALLDQNPGRNKPEIVRLINKWYKKDEKISLMAAGFYLPKNTIDPGEIILSWHNGTPEKYAYVPGQQPNLKQALFYARYAYEKLNTNDGDAERFYKLLQAYCYYEGAAGYTKDIKKAAKLAADVGDDRYVQALIGNETTLSGLSLIKKECLPGVSWSFDTSGSSTLESQFAARRNLLRDRFFDLPKGEWVSQWATFPSEVKAYLSKEAISLCALETDFNEVTSLIDAWPDASVRTAVMQNLSSDYRKKCGKVISTTKNSAEAVHSLARYEKALAESGLLSTEQLASERSLASKSFAEDVSSRSSHTFSTYGAEKTKELFAYTDALMKEGYISRSQTTPVRTALEKFLKKEISYLHTGNPSSLKDRADALLSKVAGVRKVQPEWLSGNSVVAEAETAAQEAVDLIKARALNNSAGFGKFLSSHPNGYAPYVQEAHQKYDSLLAEEQDQAAFDAAYSLTKAPSAAQKKAILSMPMSTSMYSTVASMLTGKYVRQHNKQSGSDSFRQATLNHSGSIDWNTSGPFAISAGGILGGISGDGWRYGANGFYAGVSYNFNIVKTLGIETGAYYIFEKGKFVDKEYDITEKDGLLRQAVSVPLHLTFGANGVVTRHSVSVVFFTGPSFRYNFLAKGYYAGSYFDNLHADTDWFRPFDVRYDLGLSMSISHFQMSVAGDIGLRHTNFRNGNKIADYRLYLGVGVIF